MGGVPPLGDYSYMLIYVIISMSLTPNINLSIASMGLGQHLGQHHTGFVQGRLAPTQFVGDRPLRLWRAVLIHCMKVRPNLKPTPHPAFRKRVI